MNHDEKLEELTGAVRTLEKSVLRTEECVKKTNLAVVGDTSLGITGLVKEVKDLSTWRKGIDVRVATISGCIAGLFVVAKIAYDFLKSK